jgi:ferredoxin
MDLRRLRVVRVVAALVIFLPTAFMFVDVAGILPRWIVSFVTGIQLFPSLLRTLSGSLLGGMGLLTVLVLTSLFGRVYCSTICPLGTLQDFISRLNMNPPRRRRFRFRKPFRLLHYGLLFLSIGLGLGGSMLLLNLLEPYSNFGRVVTTIARPPVIALNNGIARLLQWVDIYALYDIPLRLPSALIVIFSLGLLAIVSIMAYRHGRLFCNTLCPAGALLGILSRFSFLRLVFNVDECKNCSLCEKVCKAECINSDLMRIDESACIACFDCLAECPVNGFRYVWRWKAQSMPLPVNRRRRNFLRRSVGAASLVLVAPPDSVKKILPSPSGRSRTTTPLTPPGSLSAEHFTSLCTACHLCVSVCPTQVLVPSIFEFGLDGLFQPRMDYAGGSCAYECTLCGDVCPSGAILHLASDEKKIVQIGKAKFVKEDCIVETEKTDCGACAEHCPTKAVHMVKYEGTLTIPEVNDEVCIGCGACEHPCPVTPNKAIYVEGNPQHQIAKRPQTKKAVPDKSPVEGFPF